MTAERWLLDRAMALLSHLMQAHQTPRLVTLPPEGASLLEIERAALLAALERTSWNQKAAAALLGTTPRVMTYKVARYGLRQEGVPLRQARNRVGRKAGFVVPVPRQPGKDWRTQTLTWI